MCCWAPCCCPKMSAKAQACRERELNYLHYVVAWWRCIKTCNRDLFRSRMSRSASYPDSGHTSHREHPAISEQPNHGYKCFPSCGCRATSQRLGYEGASLIRATSNPTLMSILPADCRLHIHILSCWVKRRRWTRQNQCPRGSRVGRALSSREAAEVVARRTSSPQCNSERRRLYIRYGLHVHMRS